MKDMQFYIDVAYRLVKKFKPKFDYLKIYLTPGQSTEINVLNGNIENVSFSESIPITVVGAKNGKTATVSGNFIDENKIESLINYLQKLIEVVEEDPYFVIPDKDLIGKADADLDIFDKSAFESDVDKMVSEAKSLEEIALSMNKDVQSGGAFYSVSAGITVFANSYLFADGFEQSYFGKGVILLTDDSLKFSKNTGRKQRDGWWDYAVKKDLLSDNEAISKKAVKRVLSKKGSRKPETGIFPVIFENTVARGFFASIASALTGSNLYRKESFLLDKLNKFIAVNNLNIEDNPLLMHGLGSRLFDSDGVKSQRFNLIEKGVLKNYLLGVYSANRLGLKTTGSAGGYSNLVISPGGKNLEEMISTVEKGVLVTSLKGQGANIKTGDYSRGAEGFFIENGEIAYPISEFTVSSTFQHMLKNIKEIGNDIYKSSSILSPSILFEGITVSGK